MELDKSLSEEEYAMVQQHKDEIDPLIERFAGAIIKQSLLEAVDASADIGVLFFAIGREAGKQEANAGG